LTLVLLLLTGIALGSFSACGYGHNHNDGWIPPPEPHPRDDHA